MTIWRNKQNRILAIMVFSLALSLLFAVPLYAASQDDLRFYRQHNLVSDIPGVADHTDPNLKNSWGIAFNPNAVFWVADNTTGLATLYDGLGNTQPPIVTIPGGSPTGIVFNVASNKTPPDFVITENGGSGAAVFIFATENGIIAGWSPAVDFTNAVVAVDNSASGADYKGIAIAGNGTANLLYATDFHGAKVDVFDRNFNPVTVPGGFKDTGIPTGYAPFGIQNLNGNLYVTYAKQDSAKHDDVKGPGFGFVDVFDADGTLIRRVVSRGLLNAPWGMAIAPANFGTYSNRLLVGNFGDGRINAYDVKTGSFIGQLRGTNGAVLQIDGLWGISFGNGIKNQPTNSLFSAAGPNDENDGLFGRLEAVAAGVH